VFSNMGASTIYERWEEYKTRYSTALRQATRKTWRSEQLELIPKSLGARTGKAKLTENIPIHQHTPADE